MIIESGLSVFEGMTSISALIRAFEASPRTARRIVAVYYSKELPRDKFRQLGFLKAKSIELGFELAACDASDIDSLTSGKTHGGIIAVCSDRQFPAVSTNVLKKNGIYFMLDGIEDPYNFGYTLRSLYAAGVDGVVLGVRNWMSAAGTVARSSAGCSELIDIFVDTPENAVRIFKASGFKVFSANIRDSVSLYDTDLRSPALFVIGGEKRGISRCVLDETDVNIRIEYGREFSGSLPTAQAAAIIAFEAARANGRIK
ncbi:MAG: RNA methyltransferase [Clostridia bacterium]|nr:RNA methyltransferase [Clostridia bacterium]